MNQCHALSLNIEDLIPRQKIEKTWRYPNMSVSSKRTGLLLACMVAGGTLTGCLDTGSDDTDSYYDGSDAQQSSAGGSCGGFTDIVSSSERAAANSCGTQTSSYYAQADAALTAAIASCQQGDSSAANEYYNHYKEVVSLGRDVKASICDGSSGGSGSSGGYEDTSSAKYYNLCVKSTAVSGGYRYAITCYGPVQRSVSSCGSGDYSYLNKHSSRSACTSEGQGWLDRNVN